MIFSTYEFIFVFLPISFFVYFYLNKKRLTIAAKAWMVFSSLFFYGWWNAAYLSLILASILFNYAIGTAISKAEMKAQSVSRKPLLVIGILFNISLLGYFKYADFFIQNINVILDEHVKALGIVLPLAISFFTFQQIAYLVDSYKRETKEYDFLNYTLFVTFFPQLIAGPIVHHKEMMPQFRNPRAKIINYKNIFYGLLIFSIGLFKKVVVADNLAPWVAQGFDHADKLNFFEAWVTSLSYTFQLYFDFSGYADMAIGIALLFNIKLPINFNSPYKALSIQDFWRRWHITLSRFLRDYIYIPLGGNRYGEIRTYNNLFLTFLIGGLWHGAGWTFVFWGGLHGIGMILHRIWSRCGYEMKSWLAWIVTFNFVNITWVFFRANNWSDAVKVLRGMFDLSSTIFYEKFSAIFTEKYIEQNSNISPNIHVNSEILNIIFVCFLLVLFAKNTAEKFEFTNLDVGWNSNVRIVYYAVLMIIGLGAISLQEYSEFIYFNF